MAGTERQQEAITTHDASLVVCAGAGTGKTHVLVNKYINLLETFGADLPPGRNRLSVLNILALTFTDKAAAEMKERIRAELDMREGEYWERARLEFLIAPVQTFHSFCAGVLREFAFEAGLDPSFAVLDERESSRILTLSFRDLIHTPADGNGETALVTALAVAGSFSLEKMIRYLYYHREEADHFFSRFSDNREEVVARWDKEIRAYKEREMHRFRSDPEFIGLVQSLSAFASMAIMPDDLAMVYLQKIKPVLEIFQSTVTSDEFLDAVSMFLKEKLGNKGSKKNWTEDQLNELRDTYKKLNTLLSAIVPLVQLKINPGTRLHDLTIRFLDALGVSFTRFCAIVDLKKSDAGGLDFTDLIRHTKTLFSTRQDLVATYYRDRYRYILIDEFQDTDPAQFEIVRTITGEPSPDVNSLFIVGDPKQSIYLFRDADVTRFREAQELVISGCKGRNIPLDVCFRSSPAVITFVNHLFSRLFRTAEKPWEFIYDPISVSRDRADHGGSVTLMLIPEESGITEPEAVAEQIDAMIRDRTIIYEEGPRDENGRRRFDARPAMFRDIAILLERRTNLGLYVHSLAACGIPYYIHKGTGFYKRQEILDLISLISVLCRPYDDVHLVGLLRSPYFGLSDLDIVRISRLQGSSFFEKFGNASPDYHREYSLLSGWLKITGRLKLVPLIEKIMDESGILSVYGGLTEGEQILSNIGKMLRIVSTREERGRYLLPDLVTDLMDAFDREEDEGEAMIDDPEQDAVTIMTVHSAKGLEFPLVFVPEMASSPNMTHGPLLMESSRDLLGVMLPDPDAEFQTVQTPIYQLLRKELEEKLIAEKRRLLYVALTRSADHLVMSGVIGDALPDGTGNTRLDWILPALGISGTTVQEGYLTLRDDDRRQMKIRILVPALSDRGQRTGLQPFSIPEDLRDARGMFVKGMLPATLQAGVPCQASRIAECPAVNATHVASYGEEDAKFFGTAVHEVLRGRDPLVVISELGIENEDQQARLRSVYADFFSNPLITGVKVLKRELAFTVTLFDLPITGRIDLVVQQENGTWLVIDYKSDSIQMQDPAEKRSYLLQIEIYRRAAEMFGMKPAQGAMYSVYHQRLVMLENWDDDQISELLHSHTMQENVII